MFEAMYFHGTGFGEPDKRPPLEVPYRETCCLGMTEPEPRAYPPADEHPLFPPPADRDVPVWRYVEFPKFIDLLERRKMFFSRADYLGDPFEGSVTRGNHAVGLPGAGPVSRVFTCGRAALGRSLSTRSELVHEGSQLGREHCELHAWLTLRRPRITRPFKWKLASPIRPKHLDRAQKLSSGQPSVVGDGVPEVQQMLRGVDRTNGHVVPLKNPRVPLPLAVHLPLPDVAHHRAHDGMGEVRLPAEDDQLRMGEGVAKADRIEERRAVLRALHSNRVPAVFANALGNICILGHDVPPSTTLLDDVRTGAAVSLLI